MSHPMHPSHDTDTQTATQDVARLKAVLEAERRTHRQPAIRMDYVIVAWCFIVPFALWKLWESVTRAKWAEALGWTTLLGLSTQLHRIAQSRTQTRAAQQLAQIDNVAAIGMLAEALEWPDTGTRKSAIEALTRLLPLLDVTDSGRLDARQRACLYRMLQPQNARHYSALLIAILKALEQVGDETALPFVRRMTQGHPASSDTQRQVQEAALRCLPRLEERIVELSSSRTLLRASAPEHAGAATLLRPSVESAADPQQLLRASDRQDSPEI